MNFKEEVLTVKNEIIATAQRLLQFNTVRSAALPNAPFGRGNREALDYVLNIGKEWGFRTKDLDGYAGFLEFGQGEDVVVIMPHLDVVPEGDGWNYPPFGGEIHDGKIYGRGATDDKGPAAAALYAFKLVRDSGLPINKKVRLVFGVNEESGFDCVKHYIKKEGLPTCGFTPDGAFPVINAEKGVINGSFSFDLPPDTAKLLFTGGTACNVVPEYAKAVYEGKTYEATGLAAHASTPEAGDNAIIKLACELTGINHPVLEFLKIAANKETLGITMQDAISGELTYNLSQIKADEKAAKIAVNIRYPVTKNAEEIIEKLKAVAAEHGFRFEDYTDSPAHYVSADAPLVKSLLAAYAEVTGLPAEPVATGVGTYARVLKNFVAYGARFPHEPNNMHQKNECIAIEALVTATEIYANAIYRLAAGGTD